ncbi:MAG: hypothetical protein A2445_02595 [Candidatus Jacksonbacteria bacterium RIFOXYC2_FULL_44_29]|nr:MAG: ATP-dependent Clp protease ATPase subunit [Parcubacteria group bacterium GW2011_GWA2_42_28]KKT55891.1 MAG: ATP-dependent Clp protease ATPase subunit [Parcubacteria group bacterium GW2011_GWC2_44_22]OGY74505.1 MAG: hypothetical protein A2240_02850 [Candidatus Jacksonbacteria bacterium RIFOXYA2_FULL_43_12]OGY77414.1 MAG: hypothetical protein A2295_01800 [Candidatus Jacksonbacteria bacterium RIFOXYB2_FULL_44_15]OGY78186.1 MAG: hypothetical protein A2550_06145 [Candidatus Jacksonbacteria ba
MEELFVVCPQCQGAGFVGSAPCPECSQTGKAPVYLKIGQKTFFFDFNKLTPWEITKRRSLLKLDFVINFTLYCIAGLGILLLAFYIYQRVIALKVSLPLGFLAKDFWLINNIYLRLFLFTFLSDLYLIYRFARQEELEEYVIKKEYARFPKPGGEKPRLIDITETFNHLTRNILEETFFLAYNNQYHEVNPLHLLATLLPQTTSKIILWRLGINAGVLVGKIKRGLEGCMFAEMHSGVKHEISFSAALQKILLQAYWEVYNRGGNAKVKLTDLWIPLAEVGGYAREILYDLDIEAYKLRHLVLWIELEENLRTKQSHRRGLSQFKSKYGMNRAMTAVQTRYLNAFSRDITSLARQGALPPSLGHEREMEQIYTVFQGGAHGIVLVGRPGVGKSSMVEELAQQMAAEMVPEILQDKRLVSLSVASLLAGGDPARASERLYQALYETAHSGNIVLFIKDIQNLVGVGLRAESGTETMGIDQVLVQILEGGRFLVIGTADYKSYTKYVERSALGQILARIDVPEPNFEDTVLMLEARVPFIEGKHNVFFAYQALEKAVELSNKLIHTENQPEKSLKILQEVAAQVASERGPKTVVTETDVAKIVSRKINMPLAKIEQEESVKLMNLEAEIHAEYIDQDYAVSQVSAALRRARAELRDERRPIANFLFVGPTGVGKTELAKRIAEIYFGSEKNMIRIDMSEFQEMSSIQRLLGTAHEPGLLTEPVRNSPYCILLLDELEKAHKNILNLFLQVMDDGRMTSAEGEVIDFTNLIIVATSNAGTKKLQEKLQQGAKLEEIREEFIKQDLLEYFKPEFLNRFDDIIIFKPLSIADIEQIANLILIDIAKRLELKGITFKVTPQAVQELAHLGFDPLYGARPLRRAIQDHVQNALAAFLISGAVGRRDVVYLEAGGEIRIEKAPEL